MSAQLNLNTHQAYGFAYDQLVVGWAVPQNPGQQKEPPTAETKGSAPDQLTASSTYDFNTGVVLTATDENNQVTTLYYFPDSLRLDYILRPDTSYTRWHYGGDALVYAPDAAHLNSYVAVATSTAVGKVVWDWTFMDGRGAVARHFKGNPQADQWESTDVEYDEMGRVKRTSNAYYSIGCNSAINPAGLWTSVEQYDGLGRATQVRLPDLTTVQTAYAGTVTTVTDQAGRQRRQLADALGRVFRVDEPDASGSLGTTSSPAQPTSYEYDVLGNLTKVIQAEAGGGVTQQRVFRYDSLGHMTHQKQVEANATLDDDGLRVSSGGQWTDVYKYNNHGLLIDAYDARGVHTILEYDGLNRIKHVSYIGESGAVRTPAVTYTYDEAHSGYLNKGRLTEVKTDAVTATGVQSVPQTIQAYDYDFMGRVKSQRQSVGTGAYSLSYAYNQMGQLTSETYPSGRVVSYDYDDGARLSQVRNGSAGNYASAFTYKAHGGLESMTLGNGAIESVSYNSRLQPTQIKLNVAGVERQRFDYQYGAVNISSGTVDATKNTGQVGRIEGSIDGVRQWQQRFVYDSIGRLEVAAEHKGNDLSLTWGSDYGYDRFGNRIQVAGQTSSLPYIAVTAEEINKANNRLTSNMTYDDAGNVVVDQKFRDQQYAYDGNGRQVRVAPVSVAGESTAVYDGLGQRVQTTENGTTKTLVYDQFGQLVAEYGGQAVGTGGTHYMMADNQGSTRVVMNNGGGVEARHDYQPFGEEIGSSTGLRTPGQGYGVVDSTRQRYAGMERDESGLDHTLWRKYEQKSGRWTSPDPYGGSMSIGDPQSFNRYAYVGNDPVNRSDLKGLDWNEDNIDWFSRMGFNAGSDVPFGMYGLSGHFSGGGYGRINLSAEIEAAEARYEANLQWTISIYWALKKLQQNTGQQLLEDGLGELKKRLKERPDCAKLFGGEKKALSALGKTKIRFGNLDGGAIAETKGKNVTLDSSRFTESGATLAIAQNIRVSTVGGHLSTTYTEKSITLTGVTFAAFALFHELGHRSKIYGAYDNDGHSMYSNLEQGANNEKVRAACFGEITPQ